MDIFAHGLWAGAGAVAANRKWGKQIRWGWACFWGMFPDLFAFTPMFLTLIRFRFFGQGFTPRLLFSRALREALPPLLQPTTLYPVSHSLVIFAVVFVSVWRLRRRPSLAMLGWSLHILMDIPTHGSGTYRTPFLWPVSSYRFSGIWWTAPWFMIFNYSALAVIYLTLLYLSVTRRRQQVRPAPQYSKTIDIP